MSATRQTIYVSSRKSQLAMAQTNEVIASLQVRVSRFSRCANCCKRPRG